MHSETDGTEALINATERHVADTSAQVLAGQRQRRGVPV